MKFLNRLERTFGSFAVPHLTLFILALQAFVWAIFQSKPDPRAKLDFLNMLVLTHEGLMHGQLWRLLTVLFIPPTTNILWLFLFLYFFYMIGTVLETQWGTFRYNLYLLIGYLGTVLAALIPSDARVTNFYLIESIFLAFAWLFPDFELLVFFILPVKVKWMGLVVWGLYAFTFIAGGLTEKAEVAAGAINFVIFFHDELFQWARTSQRKFKGDMGRARDSEAKPPMHVCAVCGVSDQSDKKMEFRYCPLCTGTPAYCINHIQNHEHK